MQCKCRQNPLKPECNQIDQATSGGGLAGIVINLNQVRDDRCTM